MQDLNGRVCLITGCSAGLGAHFARELSKAGAKIVAGARRKKRVEALAEEIRAKGGQAIAVSLDVTDEASIARAFDEAEKAFGPVDTVIANAGISSPGRATDVKAAAVQGVLDTNVLGVFLTAREGARRMIAAGAKDNDRGRIVLIGSIAADVTALGEAMYSASKAAVAHMGRNLAREWVRQGVNVNVIQPGFILTEMAKDWFDTEKGKQQIAGFHRRRLQPIESLTEPVLYFCSDASAATTGAVLTVDDGQSLL